MDQIAQDDQPGGLPRGTERFQSLKGVSITVTGKRNPAGLKHLGFAEMQVSNKQLSPCGSPECFLAEQQELLGVPAPVAGLTLGHGLRQIRVLALLNGISGVLDGQRGE